MRKEKVVNILRVAKYLQENPDSYLRDISRNLNLSTSVVHRSLKELENFIITRSVNTELETKLPNLPVFIRLKDSITFEGIVNYFAKKKKLDEIVAI